MYPVLKVAMGGFLLFQISEPNAGEPAPVYLHIDIFRPLPKAGEIRPRPDRDPGIVRAAEFCLDE